MSASNTPRRLPVGSSPPKGSPQRAGSSTASWAGPHPRLTTKLLAVGVISVVAAALVIGLAVGHSSTAKSPARAPLEADTETVVARATSVPTLVSDRIGRGNALFLPKALTGPPLASDGKPELLYIGAEYCPYCAAERWPLVVALSRFGTFSNLDLTHSSSTDVYADTPSFTFHGASFTSRHLTFTAVEKQTNQPDGNGGYQSLETPTVEQEAILRSLDPSGGIPFIDIGGRYVISGATYHPEVLQGKTAREIALSLADPGR